MKFNLVNVFYLLYILQAYLHQNELIGARNHKRGGSFKAEHVIANTLVKNAIATKSWYDRTAYVVFWSSALLGNKR